MLNKNILRGRDNFSKVYNKGKSVGSKYVVVFFLKNNLKYTRLAFLASKKVGNSVARNRARRLMKESYRLADYEVSPGYDIIFIARNTITEAKCGQVARSMEGALSKTGVIKK
ncbi:MAG: ribonuclease P protein component [Clostridia bacterium]|nr:ribonuclease P protein component [Clostridia bacterium]